MRFTRTSLLFALLSLTSLARAGEIPFGTLDSKTSISASWKWSLVPLVASQALDIDSSYGKHELNPLLADPGGRFGAGSATVKLGITAGLIGFEYLIVKAHPAAARVFTKLNWAAAGVTAGVAAHNFTIR
jgi:hypothetical protein